MESSTSRESYSGLINDSNYSNHGDNNFVSQESNSVHSSQSFGLNLGPNNYSDHAIEHDIPQSSMAIESYSEDHSEHSEEHSDHEDIAIPTSNNLQISDHSLSSVSNMSQKIEYEHTEEPSEEGDAAEAFTDEDAAHLESKERFLRHLSYSESKRTTDEERAKRLAEYENELEAKQQKHLLVHAEVFFMIVIVICAIAAVITIVVMRDQIWPPSSMENMPPSTPTPTPLTGKRDEIILDQLRLISDDLPEKIEDIDFFTSQSIAAHFVIHDDPLKVKVHESDRIKQRYILVTLYYATRGDDWTDRWYWLSHESECKWHGIYCDSSDTYVTKIILQNNNLNGIIPSEINSLINLTDISIVNNFSLLSGQVLPILTPLNTLKVLDLRNNNFDGKIIPSMFVDMESLRILYLEGNKFSGIIPSDIAKSQSLGKRLLIIYSILSSLNFSLTYNISCQIL